MLMERVNKAMCTSLVATLLHVYDDTILATKIFTSEWDFHPELSLARFQLNLRGARLRGDPSNNPANRFKHIQSYSPIYMWILSPYYNSHGTTIELVVTRFV